ncbi:MAG: M20/M25/M40 family metallo-hydrolase [archaeon]|nr:M20/M25/M40 family metallo-hydrolase [archaeon]MDA1168096.1 M20/M25/M40 family metallo-hydrolase [archaeon]
MSGGYVAFTVQELREEAKQRGLPVSGNKSELIERLHQSDVALNKFNNDEVDDDSQVSVIMQRLREPAVGPISLGGVIAFGIAIMLVSTVLIVRPAWLGFGENYDYELIDFEQDSARRFAENLVSFGHPDWEGRMSGTSEERNVSEYILSEFEAMGMKGTLHPFDVPMHHVNSEPSFRVCVRGGLGLSPCDGALSFTSDVTSFQHRIDYVIQGFSGQSEYTFNQDVQVTDLGNGSDEGVWQQATGTLGYIRSGGTISGNTAMYVKAVENDLAGLIRVNKDYNCGKIEGNDCVPIFKGSSIDSITEANGGSVPTDIPFIAMSKDAGELFESLVFNGSQNAAVELIIDVTNDQQRTVYVPCGDIDGKTSEVIIAGGHHDTVYHGQGAIDDTSGSASVLEMARQISSIVNKTGQPDRTIRFCTWGGEEEGLYGSRAYVDKFKSELKQDLRLYINLDMNHVDADFANRGNSLTLFTNNEDDYDHIVRIMKLYKDERPEVANKYDILTLLLEGQKGEPNGMPYNSDHGPFVYDLGESYRGRAVVCYGSGSWEYHTYLDTLDRFNEESLGVSVTIYGTYMRYLAYNPEM